MAFLIGGPRTFVIFAIWDGEEAMLEFATQVDVHHAAVRMCFANAAMTDGRTEIWSAQWRMWSASNNLEWDDQEDFAVVAAPAPTDEFSNSAIPMGSGLR